MPIAELRQDASVQGIQAKNTVHTAAKDETQSVIAEESIATTNVDIR